MNKSAFEVAKEAAKLVLHLSLIAFVLVLTHAVHSVEHDAHDIAFVSERAVGNVDLTVRSIRAALLDKNDGLLAIEHETHDAVRQSRKLVDTALKTSLDERANIQRSSDETVALIGHADQAVTHLDQRTEEISTAFAATADEAQHTLEASARAMDAAAGLLGDPAIHATLRNLDSASADAAQMSADAQKKFHLLLFPPKQPWYQRALNFTKVGGQIGWEVLTLTH